MIIVLQISMHYGSAWSWYSLSIIFNIILFSILWIPKDKVFLIFLYILLLHFFMMFGCMCVLYVCLFEGMCVYLWGVYIVR